MVNKSQPSTQAARQKFNVWFDANYYTIDPIARETAFAAWQEGRASSDPGEARPRTGIPDLEKGTLPLGSACPENLDRKEMCCKHCYDEGYQVAIKYIAEQS